MPETRPLLERVMERVELRPFTLEGFHDRRDRKRRNQRIRAGVLGIAIAIAVGWLGVNAIRSAPPVPADPTPTLPSSAGTARSIVFEPRATGKGWDLAAQDPQTGEVRTIVETDGIIDCPDAEGCRSFVREAEWSADGRWLAFEVTHANLDGPAIGPCAPTVGVWVTNALGELGQLTTPCDAPPAPDAVEEVWEWSPVGARLAYARVDGETDELFVIDPWTAVGRPWGRRTSNLGTGLQRRLGGRWSGRPTARGSPTRTGTPSTWSTRMEGNRRCSRTRSRRSSRSPGLPMARTSWSTIRAGTGSRS